MGYTALLVAGWRALHAISAQPLVRDDYAKHFISTALPAKSALAGLLRPGLSVTVTIDTRGAAEGDGLLGAAQAKSP